MKPTRCLETGGGSLAIIIPILIINSQLSSSKKFQSGIRPIGKKSETGGQTIVNFMFLFLVERVHIILELVGTGADRERLYKSKTIFRFSAMCS